MDKILPSAIWENDDPDGIDIDPHIDNFDNVGDKRFGAKLSLHLLKCIKCNQMFETYKGKVCSECKKQSIINYGRKPSPNFYWDKKGIYKNL